MRRLTLTEFKACQMMANLFEESIDSAHFSSPMFIRRFMTSDLSKKFENADIIATSLSNEEIIEELNTRYESSTKAPMFNINQMHWIGFIYCAISLLSGLSMRSVYKALPSIKIHQKYFIYHTYNIEDAAENILEEIHFTEESLILKGVELLREMYRKEGKKPY